MRIAFTKGLDSLKELRARQRAISQGWVECPIRAHPSCLRKPFGRMMNGLSLINPIDPAQLQKETQRIYEVCDGCRRCFNLCPSFNTLLDGIDRYEGDVAKLTPTDHHRVVDECYYCKLCFNHCPYTPPHQYALDFPRLMIAWKKHLGRERGVGWRDRLLIKTDLIGTLGAWTAPLSQLGVRKPIVRRMARWDRSACIGIDRSCTFLRRRFPAGGAEGRHRPASAPGKSRCLGAVWSIIKRPMSAKRRFKSSEKNGVHVVVPEQRCCGMPSFDIGDTAAIQQAASANVASFYPWVEQGYDIVVPVPSCSLMWKREYPELSADEADEAVAERTFDVCEYLMKLKKEGSAGHRLSCRSPGESPIRFRAICGIRTSDSNPRNSWSAPARRSR